MPPTMASGTRTILACSVAVAYACWATSLRPFTGGMLAAAAVAAITAIAAGLRRRRSPPAERRAGAAVWAVIVVALAVWEAASFLHLPRAQHPTLSSLANTAFGSHPVRALAMAGWMAFGAWAARR